MVWLSRQGDGLSMAKKWQSALVWGLLTPVVAAADLSPSALFRVASPSIVVMEALGKDGKAIAQGSGVVIAPGVVVSNCHVFTKAATAVVRYQQHRYAATLKHGDPDRDLCSFAADDLPAPAATLGVTSTLAVGDSAYAIGAPQGLELSLSGGLIASLRSLHGGRLLQVTTPISPGSSGGGLFDSQGRLIGITTMYLKESQQLNFAVPVEWVNELPGRSTLLKGGSNPSQIARTEGNTREELRRAADSLQPTLVLTTVKGEPYNLASHRGKWVVVNFWATWCVPCVKQITELSKLQTGHKNIDVVGLVYEDIDTNAVQLFLEKHPVKYEIAIVDIYNPPADFDAPRGLPTNYLIAPNGMLFKKILGPLTASDVEAAIDVEAAAIAYADAFAAAADATQESGGAVAAADAAQAAADAAEAAQRVADADADVALAKKALQQYDAYMLKSDANYAASRPLLDEKVRVIRQTLPPSEWLDATKKAYIALADESTVAERGPDRFRVLSDTKGLVTTLDTQTVRRDGRLGYAWLMGEYSTPLAAHNGVVTVKQFIVYDCVARTSAMKENVGYGPDVMTH